MIKLFYLALLVAFLTSNVANACSWGRTTLQRLNSKPASMVTSENNKFLLKMIPSQWNQKDNSFFKIKESIGTVFKLGQQGHFLYQWNAKGIHPKELKAQLPKTEYFAVLLSNDGKRVAKVKRFGNFFGNNKRMLINKDFLVIFKQGKITHRYSYLDIFKNRSGASAIGIACPGLAWVSDIKLEDNLLSFKPGHSSLKNSKARSVDIASGKTVE